MGQKKEPEQNKVSMRVCPKCAKAFYALESECASCYHCGTPVAEFD